MQTYRVRPYLDTSEFGVLSQKEITQTLEHIFGAKTKKSHGKKMLEFDISKLKRLGNIYDLFPEVKVIEESRDVGDVGDDVGIGRYIAASTGEHELISGDKLIEREDTPNQGLPDPPHGPDRPHGPPNAVDWDKVKKASEWALKELQELESNPTAKVREYERRSKLARKKTKTAANAKMGEGEVS